MRWRGLRERERERGEERERGKLLGFCLVDFAGPLVNELTNAARALCKFTR